MADKSYRPYLAAVLSLVICGAGQIYLHRILKGVIFLLSFLFAMLVLYFATSQTGFKMLSIYGHEIMFNPAMKSVGLGMKSIKVTDIMEFTGGIQLIFTWIYSIIDAWTGGKELSSDL